MNQIETMSNTMNVSTMNGSTMNVSQTNISQTNISQTNVSQTNIVLQPTKKTKNNYKNMMLDLMKPLPKEDIPNIHLGGGIFPKMEKI
jgi:hypothetical protein